VETGDRLETKATITAGTVRVIVGGGGLNLEIDTPPNKRCSCDGAWLVLTPDEAEKVGRDLLDAAKAARR
jgi:hypothetical protein